LRREKKSKKKKPSTLTLSIVDHSKGEEGEEKESVVIRPFHLP